MEDDAVFLYEMYSEHIQMTKKLQEIFTIRNQIPEFPIPQPEFYIIDLQFNRELELHILSLKKGITNRSGGSKNEPNILHEETRLSFRPTVSTADLSGIIPQISGIGLNPNEKQLFQPPIFQRRKSSSHHAPQIFCKTATEHNYDNSDDSEEAKEEPSKKKVEGGPSGNYLKAPQSTDPFKMNFLQIPNESQVYLQKNRGSGIYNALDVSSPNMSSNNSFSDSYIVG